jgi:hypothetical protein
MPVLRLTGEGAQGKNKLSTPQEYDVELTDTQWTRYIVARREGRLHVTTDEKRGLYVIAEQVKPGQFDVSQLKEGAEILEQGKVIAMGKLEAAKGNVDNSTGKRS